MVVLKFGGSSIANSNKIENSLKIINNYKNNIIVIFSAFGGVTDLLMESGKLAGNQDKKYLKKFDIIKKKTS